PVAQLSRAAVSQLDCSFTMACHCLTDAARLPPAKNLARVRRAVPQLCVCALLASVLAAPCFAAADRPPNIVIILTDDQGYGDVGCFGAKEFATPNLDRM